MDKVEKFKAEHEVNNYLVTQAELAFTALCQAYHQLMALPLALEAKDEVNKRILLRSISIDLYNLSDIFFKQRVFLFGKDFGPENTTLEAFQAREKEMTYPRVNPIEWIGKLDGNPEQQLRDMILNKSEIQAKMRFKKFFSTGNIVSGDNTN